MMDSPPTPPPDSPGCYIFRSKSGKPLYIGKAKNLKSRVASYFGAGAGEKASRLREESGSLEYIVTKSEWEAFLLENNLIKQFHPHFNVLLKDDKTYPLIKLTVKDAYPKAVFTRRVAKDGALYFGPFVLDGRAKKNLEILQKQFKVATCKDPLDGSRPRPCLLYEMGQCYAPCVKGRVERAIYLGAVDEARLFLEGHSARLRKLLEKKMARFAALQEYELAAHYRDLIAASRNLGERQAVSRPGEGRWEFFALYGGPSAYSLCSFTLVDGKIVDRRRWKVDGTDLPREELFESLITGLFANASALPDGVAVSEPFEGMEMLGRYLSERKRRKVKVLWPRKGEKARVIATLAENARMEFEAKASPEKLMAPLCEAAGLAKPPVLIECFDISHIHGEAPSASCVAWESGRMNKKMYRSFNIASSKKGDDYAAIAEAVTRRYSRQIGDGARLPDLVLIDGGAGQVKAAGGALAALTANPPALLGIAKREEWLFRPGQTEPVILPKDSPSLHLLQSIRDEAHRFALSRHRARRSKARMRSPLMAIPGIGPATAKKLLMKFLTTGAVKEATEEELAMAVGKRAAKRIRDWASGAEAKPWSGQA